MSVNQPIDERQKTTIELISALEEISKTIKGIGDMWQKQSGKSDDLFIKASTMTFTILCESINQSIYVQQTVVEVVTYIAIQLGSISNKIPDTNENKAVKEELTKLRKQINNKLKNIENKVQNTLTPIKDTLEEWQALDLKHEKEGHGIE